MPNARWTKLRIGWHWVLGHEVMVVKETGWYWQCACGRGGRI